MALVAESLLYFESLQTKLVDIDTAYQKGLVSSMMMSLTNTSLWQEPAEKWSEMSHCYYEMRDDVFELKVSFTVPEIDTRMEILEASSFKFWNQTSPNKFCRMKYAGPRYILANHTNNCYLDIDTDWLHRDALEDHPCNGENSIGTLSRINFPFHSEACVNKLIFSTNDIQVKRMNGFIHIYCLGHEIILEIEHDCPEYVFELAATDSYTLNGHVHKKLSRRGVLIDPHEVIVNKEIAGRLKLNSVKIRVYNQTTLNQKLEAFSNAIADYGKNLTMKSFDVNKVLISPFGTVIDFLSQLWSYLQHGIIVLVALVAACLLVAVSPLLRLLLTLVNTSVRLTRVAAKHESKRMEGKLKTKYEKLKNYYV